MQVLRVLGHGFTLDGLFLYKALWSVLFGVAVTAVIDVLVDRDKLARLFGGRGFKATGLATLAGSASSACTYGAVTVAQTLFKKGASVEATYAFALAATNIVFELGILIYILLGGVFLGGELVAGVLLVAGMWLLVRVTLPQAVFAAARNRLQAGSGEVITPAIFRAPPATCGHPGPLPVELARGATRYRFCSPQCRDAFIRRADGPDRSAPSCPAWAAGTGWPGGTRSPCSGSTSRLSAGSRWPGSPASSPPPG